MRALSLVTLVACSGLLAASPRIQFEPNLGQTDAQVSYLARTPQGLLFFSGASLVLSRPQAEPVTLEWLGANSRGAWEPSEPTGATTSYYVGRDPARWAENVPEYGRLTRRRLYPGIDLVYYGSGRQIEYDLLVGPGADPGRLRFRVRGAKKLSVDGHGDLVIATEGGEIRQHTPALYQTNLGGSRTRVPGRFRLLGGDEVGFASGRYDRTRVLAIDPTIESSTYLGGSGDDEVIYSANGFIAGNTTSADFPGAVAARRAGWDIFYQSGTSTSIFGGSGDDHLTGAASAYGGPILFGYTNSQDLPTSPSSLQPNYGGGANDGFFLYFSQSGGFGFGTTISYLGGPGEDRITAMAGNFGSTVAFTGWTTGRGFFAGLTTMPVDGPGGGTDGFIVTAEVAGTGTITTEFFLASSRYFGGSGDDRPSSIAFSSYLNSYGYYISGETTSADFPGLTGASTARSGDSDAFLIRYNSQFPGGSPTSVLYGGNGTDRAAGVAVLGNGPVVIAGATSSTDLPLANPAQATFGGGASDGFVAEFSADLSQMTYASYWGGSAADEATSASGSPSVGEVFIGGWTASPDFPVSNAVQSSYGGGPDDGFLVHYDPDGKVYEATFLGGSGSDRVLGVSAGPVFEVSLTGRTTSPDFPLTKATQTALLGNSDGFVTVVNSTLFVAPHVTGSSGLRAYAYIAVPTVTPPVAFTLTSSDPGSVVLASQVSGPAAASITLSPQGTEYYYVDCLANGVSANINITAPGFPSKTARVDCVPASLAINLSGNTLTTTVWANPATVYLYLFAVNPSNPSDGNDLFAKSDADQVSVQVQTSDATVATPSVTSVLVGSASAGASVAVSPVGLGSTDLVFSSPSLQARASDRVHVVVGAPLTLSAPNPIPGGFESAYFLSLPAKAPSGTTITLTSSDPSRLLVSADRTKPGAASATANEVFLQALDTSGTVTLTASVPGYAPVSVPVTLRAPVLTLSSSLLSTPKLSVGQSISVSVSFEGFEPSPASPPVRLTLANSNPTVLQVSPAYVDLSAAVAAAGFQVQGLLPGPAVLTPSSSNGVTPAAGLSALAVTVTGAALRLRDLEVGKDLAGTAALTIPLGLPSGQRITVSTSDPTRVLLSTRLTTAGKPQITLTPQQGLTFYVFGLANSGTAQITARIDGTTRPANLQRRPDETLGATATVTLRPSGIGWTGSLVSTDMYSATTTAGITGYALDSASLVPVAAQPLRPGVSASVPLQTDQAGVVTAGTPITMSSTGSTTFATLTNVGPGDATLTVIQPSGFTTPASRQHLAYHVGQAALRFSVPMLGIGTQEGVRFSSLPSTFQKQTATLTSSDPSKAVLSADPTIPGTGTLQIAAGSPFYVQALDSRGSPIITASLPGFADTPQTAPLSGTGISLTVSSSTFGGSTVTNGAAYTTLQSGTTAISALLTLVDPDTGVTNYNNYSLMLRPGLNGAVLIQSSNTAVGTVGGSPAQVTSSYNSPAVSFQPLSLGDATVSAVQLPGFTVPAVNGSVLFHVTQPQWQISSSGPIGKDMATGVGLNVAANVKTVPANVPVTVTSSDPSRLLISPDATTPGAASLSLTLAAGQLGTSGFYVQALSNQGTVPVTVTAPGFDTATTNVTLTDTYFGITLNSTRVVLLGPPAKGSIVFGTANTIGGGGVRPGAVVTVHMESSDPTVLAIDSPDITLAPNSVSQFSLRPVQAGQVTVRIVPPAGYLAYPDNQSYGPDVYSVTVDSPKLFLSPAVTKIGKDQQMRASVSTELNTNTPAGLVYTVTSSDPSLLLVSSSSTAAGSGQASVTAPASTVYLQALAGSGTVTVTLSASGSQPVTTALTLTPSGAAFTSVSNPLNLTVNGFSQQFLAGFAALDPITLQPLYPFLDPRPGYTASVTVVSSDSSVATATPATVQLSVSSPQDVLITPVKAGTTIVSLGVPPGGTDPSSGGSIVVNVH